MFLHKPTQTISSQVYGLGCMDCMATRMLRLCIPYLPGKLISQIFY